MDPTNKLILELYKSHHTAKETATILNKPYQGIAAIFRGFKAMNIKKYDRINLIPLEVKEAACL